MNYRLLNTGGGFLMNSLLWFSHDLGGLFVKWNLPTPNPRNHRQAVDIEDVQEKTFHPTFPGDLSKPWKQRFRRESGSMFFQIRGFRSDESADYYPKTLHCGW